MANEENLAIEVTVNGKQAIKELGNVDKSTDKLGKQTQETDKKMKQSTESMKTNWIAVGAAVAGVVAGLKGATDASIVQLKAETALGGALKANALQGQKTLSMWKAYASSLQEVTLYGDEATLQQVALLKSMGLTDEQIKNTIEAAMDLSAVTGQELESSVRNLAKTYSGMAGELGESIPKMRELTKEQMQAGDAVKLVSELYKGQAQAIADTDYGKITQSWGLLADAMERVGDVAFTIANDLNLPGAIETIAEVINDATLKFYQAKVSVYEFDKAINDFFGNTDTVVEYQAEIDKTLEKIAQLQNAPTDEGTTLPAVAVSSVVGGKKDDKEVTAEEMQRRHNERRFKEQQQLEQDLLDLKEEYQQAWIEASKVYHDEYQQQLDDEVEAVKEAEKAKQEAYKETQKNVKVVTDKIADSIIDAAFAGKASFADMATAMIKEMLRVYMQKFLLQAAMSFIPGGSLLGGLFHTGGEVKHTGGTIGGNLPTYHSGMRSDERVAKLQVGESVINRHGTAQNKEAIDAMNRGMTVGGGGDVTTAEINFNVQAIDAASFNGYLVNNRSTIENIINNSLRTNGSVRKTIKQVG